MSKNIDLTTIKELEAFGLNEKESLIYMELLRDGEQSAITLSKETELHRQFVYNALSSLKERGLVLQVGEQRAKWRAQSPRKFIALAEEQELRATKLSESLFGLMQQKSGQEFEVTEGREGFRQRIIDTIRKTTPDSTVRMICGEWGSYFDLAGETTHETWDRIRIAKNIYFHIIGPESLKRSLGEAAAERALVKYRIMPGLNKNMVNTVIYDEAVDFDIYGNPHVTFSIRNAEVATSQQRFFDALWEKSEKF